MNFTGNLTRGIERIVDMGRHETIFGEPRQIGDATVIPVARAVVAAGFGGGGGRKGVRKDVSNDPVFPPASLSEAAMIDERPSHVEPSDERAAIDEFIARATGEEGEGGGGGGRVSIFPVAIIRIRGGDADVIPIVDWNRIAGWAAFVLGIVAFWLGLAIARRARYR